MSLVTLAACGGTTNNTTIETSPNANGVFPANGFQGDTIRVEISGDATDWADGVTVDMGTGVTVSNVTVSSPTTLFADVAIDGTAMPGQNDVTVTDASGGSDGALTLTKAFEIDSPVTLTFEGDLNQGGLPFFTIQDLDFLHPFDATQDANTGAFVNETITSPDGVDLEVSAISTNQITGRAFIDATATGGDATLASTSGSNSITVDLGTLTVAARTPTPLATGSDTAGSVTEPGDTTLYSLSITKAAVLDLADLSSTDPNAQPAFGLLPDGTWATAASFPSLQLAAGSFDLVVGDLATEGKYDFNVNVSELDVTVSAEGDDTKNNTLAATDTTVPAANIPAAIAPMTLSSDTDVDFIKLTNVPKGKTIHVSTLDGPDAFTDTQVDIEDSTGASLNGGDIDGGETDGDDGGFTCAFEGVCGEDVSTTDVTAAAGTFFVKVSPGADFATTDSQYVVVITLE